MAKDFRNLPLNEYGHNLPQRPRIGWPSPQTLADAADNWMPDGWRDSVRPRDPDAEDDPTYGCRYCGKLYRKCTCTNAEIYEYELELRGRKHDEPG